MGIPLNIRDTPDYATAGGCTKEVLFTRGAQQGLRAAKEATQNELRLGEWF